MSLVLPPIASGSADSSNPHSPYGMAFFERPGRDSDIRLSVIDSVCSAEDGGPAGETKAEALRLDFDRRLSPLFHGSFFTSDGGFTACRELGDVLALTT